MDKIKELIRKELLGQLSDEEKQDLRNWIGLSDVNRRWYEETTSETNIIEKLEFLDQAVKKRDPARLEAIRRSRVRGRIVRFRRSLRVAAIAVLVIGLGSLLWWLRPHGSSGRHGSETATVNDFAPGSNKAILQLANGQKIELNSAGNGMLASQGGSQVVKLDSGELSYTEGTGGGVDVVYNTLSTPRGGQFKLTLPDKSQVWLNSATTLRFPTAFAGSERSVELISGEAYFEISRDPGRTFKVVVPARRPGEGTASIEVLGTNFDVNAYPDEPAQTTTLLSGSVRVAGVRQTMMLRPGQEATVNWINGVIRVADNSDAAGRIAWKDGMFHFDHANTDAVMRQLARWYDVEVIYEDDAPHPARQFMGTIPRNLAASDVLKVLELSKVHFRIEGKRIIVKP